MSIRIDLKEIKKLAEEREEENWRFRSFLKFCDYDSEKIDAIVHRLYKEVSSQIDCCKCGNCCREMHPLLKQPDINRLSEAMNCSEKELTSKLLIPSEDNPGRFEFKESPCPLLSGNRCTRYEARPENCRSYPHLHKDDFVSRLMQVIFNVEVCPIAFHVYEGLKLELWHAPIDDEEDEF
jgi:Fe-S-cluster containining protein